MSDQQGASEPKRGLGTIARRLGRWVADVSEAVSFPEALRNAIAQSFGAQAIGQHDKATQTLLNVSVQRNQTALATSADVLASLIAFDPMPARHEASATERKALQELIARDPSAQLFAATQLLQQGPSESALDLIRRERQKSISLPPELTQVRRFVLALWSAQAYLQFGRFARALLEMERVHEHLLAIASNLRAPLCVRAAELAVTCALHQGDLTCLDRWSQLLNKVGSCEVGELLHERKAAFTDTRDQAAKLLLRLQIAQSSSQTPQLLRAYPLGPLHLRAQIAGLLPPQGPDHIATLPEALDTDPTTWRLVLARELRLWAQNPGQDPYQALRRKLLRFLPEIPQQLQAAPVLVQLQLLAELALFCMAAQVHDFDWAPHVCALQAKNLRVPATVRLAQVCDAIHRDTGESDMIELAIRATENDLALGVFGGHDESSPLRWPSLRDPVMFGALSLLRGHQAQKAQHLAKAEHHFAHALACWPYLTSAQKALDALFVPASDPTLSAQLEAMAEQFTPQSSDPPEIQDTLRELRCALVVERERLARPFTLAVMGEFSAGKSTFVNALIGREVAPMGVLPTTNTVNRFRHGKGLIRVHYENGRIQYLEAHEQKHLLHDISEDKARQIQYLDIEGDFEQLADLVIVDTPGLNATQAHHERITRAFVQQADAVLWIFSATRAGASTESEILKSLRQESRPILGLLNKVDTLTPQDQQELLDYVSDQFGDLLLDIVPISASKALQDRHRPSSAGQDPSSGQGRESLSLIQDSLRRHLLDQSPEHKASVATLQSVRALDRAASKIRSTLLARESDPGAAQAPDKLELQTQNALLAVQDAWLDLDQFLLRSALDLGIVASGRGALVQEPSQDDRRYLNRRSAQRFFSQLDLALRDSKELQGSPWIFALRDWLDGYWAGLAAQDTLCGLVLLHADRAKQGERAYRDALRQGLLECSGSFVDATHPLAQRMQSWVRRTLSAMGEHQQDADAFVQRVLLPRILGAKKSLLDSHRKAEAMRPASS